jgi:drug/metabolite transporter (DMT)-like permease
MVEQSPSRDADRLLILAAALLFSTGGAAIKLTTLNGPQVACLRAGIAAAVLLLVLGEARRGWSWRIWLVGAAYAGTTIGFALSNKLTTAANAIFLQATAPLYVLLLGPLVLDEPLRRRQLWYMAALVIGMSLFFVGNQPFSATAPNPMRGNLIAAGAGLSWALTIVGLRWLGRESPAGGSAATAPAAAAVACGNLVACVVVLPFALPMFGITATDWVVVAFLGIFQIALAYIFLVRGVRSVGALEVSLLVLLEPILSPLWAWFLHGERPTTWAILGGAIIITATALYTTAEQSSNAKTLKRLNVTR